MDWAFIDRVFNVYVYKFKGGLIMEKPDNCKIISLPVCDLCTGVINDNYYCIWCKYTSEKPEIKKYREID